jgi:hypothetical protein
MKVHIREGDIHLLDVRTRMPFKYGIATMTSTPHLFLRLRVEVDGKLTTGIAADHLPPKWFTKDPARPVEEETHEMLRVIENALRLAVGVKADTPFDAWLAVHQAQAKWGKAEQLPALLTQFGTSLVERALIEAVCRASGGPFHALLLENAFGIRLADVHSSLTNFRWEYLLTNYPPPHELVVRHTVGLADPLTEAEIPEDERLEDGLPQSLTACIHAYGLRHFKIKISGRREADLDRLRRVTAILEQHAGDRYAFSLDGNEQFQSVDDFRAFCEAASGCPQLAAALDWHCAFVEQPLHRSVALDPKRADLRDWPEGGPIIIDESDAELDSLSRALALGYWGTSHKNCKGVFKSVANSALLGRQRSICEGNYILSGEDLANIGPVALLQDLTVCAVICIESVERNGHHYFAGLSMFPPDVQEQVLRHHGDLYRPSRDGWPTLNIRNGEVDIGSLLEAPFGVGFEVPVERFLTPDQWRRANPLPERRPEGGG